jgi:hypothetical protein
MDTLTRFNLPDRWFLTRQRGISDGVVAGLEALGVTSIEELAAIGVDELCERLRTAHGWDVWANRRRALKAAVEAAVSTRAASRLCQRTNT